MTESIHALKPMAAYISLTDTFWRNKWGGDVFQRLMDNIIEEQKLKNTFPYLDDITVAGINQADHGKNVEAFLTF